MRLGTAEIEVLKALARNEASQPSSPQRLRLELLGLVIDSATGLRLTEAGLNAALNMLPPPHEEYEMPPRRLDAAGRRKMHSRVMPGA
jgi:hypothetical protein